VIFEAVKGFRIPLVSLPNQDVMQTAPVFTPEQAAQIKGEVRLLLEKGMVTPVVDNQGTVDFIQTPS